ncbi:MAG: hypothetical protein ABII07_06280 [Patescibacteria group bacterium]|nr:hypothetical protein [Patescibacteria group bacterium]
MNKYTSIRDQVCPNTKCSFYNKELKGNIVIHGQKYPRFKCNYCNKTWASSLNSTCYRLKTNPQKIELVKDLLEQNFSIRKTAKIAGVSPGTVQRLKSLFFNQLQND